MYDTLLEIGSVDGACVVSVKSELDLQNAETFARYVDEASATSTSLVISFEHCRYIDSSAIRALVSWANARGNAFAIVAPRGSQVRRVLDLLRLDEIVEIHETTGAAITDITRKIVAA